MEEDVRGGKFDWLVEAKESGCFNRSTKESNQLQSSRGTGECTNMLRDAACLQMSGGYVSKCIEKSGFAMINMSHNGDDGRTGVDGGGGFLGG